MDTATALAIGRKAAKVANKVIKYIREDNEASYGLDEEVSVVLMGNGAAYAGTALVPREFTTADGSLTIAQTADAIDWGVRLVAHPFPASAHLWNGPDLIKNNQYRSMLASLFHDLIWEHAGEIAEAWGIDKQAVLQWGDGVLYAIWLHASGDSLLGRLEARAAWQVCEFSRGWYHTAKKWLGLHSIAVAAMLTAAGCGTPPDWTVAELEGTNAVLRAMGKAQAAEVVPQGTEGAEGAGEAVAASAKPWKECRYSSNWDGANASKRMMNLLSPKFGDDKAKQYLDWQQGLGCDHCHVFLVNQGDGEGAGYDALADAATKEKALKRVRQIRARGMGVVLWIVADDSDGYRKKVFADPAKYAKAAADFFPYASYICLGLEMDEGEGSAAKWKALRDALKAAGWTGKTATHHTSGKATHAGLGEIVMDQLDPGCGTADIAKSVKALRAKGYEVCGFEYSRGPDKAKAQAALDAGAFACGNWKGSASTTTTPATGTTQAAATGGDAVAFSDLAWSYGGFSGKGAKAVAGVEIGSLKVSSSGMSYKWAAGGCEKLGASSREDASCLACLFVRKGGTWKGGKFDWISTSRTSRGFENIAGGYNGWPKDAIATADAYAFCIVSKDGGKRTNVIVQEGR